ncbi:hypothetical protein HYH03_001116 [Edaphochlamys debaryana]|nr:hypothetical protein HYH03_001116 [Edaphochlamys debaryana]|eukprot:KAG2501323.1 hypothetical protein HYH03_001116 [Edaphochlamys debaryana]
MGPPSADKSPGSFKEPTPEQLIRIRNASAILNAELMEQIPAQFDPAFKNPCWTTGDGRFRCLPYFYVTGLFHAGAISLSEKLRLHPDVLTDACSGCQFWGEIDKKMGHYLDHMKEAASQIRTDPSKVLMDSSPSTFSFYWASGGKPHIAFQEAIIPCFQGCSDKANREKIPVGQCMDRECYNMSLARDQERAKLAGIDWRTEAHNPLLVRGVYGARPPKMILLAREPLRRLFSAYHGYPHYHAAAAYGREAIKFGQYAGDMVRAVRACEADYTPLLCATLFEALGAREEAVYFHADQIFRGMYGLYLEIWFRFIPPQHWLVLDADEYFEQPKQTLAKVIDFLGLSKVNDTVLDKMVATHPHKSWTQGQEPMLPATREYLAEFYRPYNSLLAQLTGNPRFEKWNEIARQG